MLKLVQGEREPGVALANHQDIDGLFFTGSPQVGRSMHNNFARDPGKILALEVVGNNPVLVSDQIVDQCAAVHAIIQCSFVSAGQRCTCAHRRLFFW